MVIIGGLPHTIRVIRIRVVLTIIIVFYTIKAWITKDFIIRYILTRGSIMKSLFFKQDALPSYHPCVLQQSY